MTIISNRKITVKELLRRIKALNVDKNAVIKIPGINGMGWRSMSCIIYSKTDKEVSLW